MGKGRNAKKQQMWLDFSLNDYSSDEEFFGMSPSWRGTCSTHKGQSEQLVHNPQPPLKPRNAAQKVYLEKLENTIPHIVVASGPAGTGKTLLATHVGMRLLTEGKIRKLVLTRPAVSVDEEHGFLPGTLEEKMQPWLAPIYDVFYQYYPSKKIKQLMEQQIIEICPLAYMRGRTFSHSWIIADEMQNATTNQMLMLLTRIGTGSKLVITGDLAQHERGFEYNGLKDLVTRLQHHPPSADDVYLQKFHTGDIERHPVIQTILTLYEQKQPPSGI